MVAVGVFLAVSCSIFPALQRSRMNSRLVACQGNLRQIGLTQAQCQDLHSDGMGSGPAGGGVAMAGLPMASFLNQGGNADLLAPRPACQPTRPDIACWFLSPVPGADERTSHRSILT